MDIEHLPRPYVPALAIIFLVSAYKFLLYPVFLSPLAKIPKAHPVASFTSAWINWVRYSNVENRTLEDAHKRLGEVVRLGPSEVSINCVDDGIKTVYGKNFEKVPYYSFFANFGTLNIFSTLQSKPHAVKKKRISNTYSKSHLHSSSDVRAITSTILYDRLLPLISSKASAGKAVEVFTLFQAAAMDSATGYFFGLPAGTNFLDKDDQRSHWLHVYLHSRPRESMFFLQEHTKITSFLGNLGLHIVPTSREPFNDEVDAWCFAMCDRAEQTLASERSGNERVPGQHPVVYEQIKKVAAKEGMGGDPSIRLNSASRHEDKHFGKTLSAPRSRQQLEVASELLDQLIATHETFGITLLYATWELSRFPQVQRKLRAELLGLPTPLLHPTADGEVPDAKKVDELPYLNAVFMETLRLHPAVPGSQPRITPPKSITKLGPFPDIPENVRVSASAWNLHRNPTAFPAPDEWHPERWLEDDPEFHQWQGTDKKERWFWAFGSGGRMCVGSNFAVQMIKFIVAAMYTNFESTIVDDKGIEQDDGFIAGPKGDKLVLKFHHVSS